MKFKEWHSTALELRDKGFSGRAVAQMIGKSKTQVNDLFKYMFDSKQEVKTQENGGPKILFIDIETKPIIAHVWRLFDQNVGLNQIEQDWSILSYCAKWQHSDEIIYDDLSGQRDFEDDSRLLSGLWNLMDEAHFIVGQNSKRFDVKKINARLVLNGYPKPSTFRQIDTLEVAKQQFGFTSCRLEYMTDKLCTQHKKLSHKKFPGHTLWSECLKGNPEAWVEMREYNTNDVLSLQELYEILSSWDSKLPNFDVYIDDVLDMSVWEEAGFHYTNLGKYQKYRNKVTGVQRRGRTNLLSKEKRDSLLANIV